MPQSKRLSAPKEGEQGQWLTHDTRAIPTGSGPKWTGLARTAASIARASACSSIRALARLTRATPPRALPPNLTNSQPSKESERETCVLFPGQGTQKKGMADKLLADAGIIDYEAQASEQELAKYTLAGARAAMMAGASNDLDLED